MRVLVASMILALAMPTLASAEDQVVEPQVAAFIAKLEGGDKEAAVASISGVHGLMDATPWVRTRGEFVDLVIGCKATLEKAAADTIMKLHRYSWECEDGSMYFALLGKHPRNDYIEVVDPADEAHKAKQDQRSLMTMKPTLPPSLKSVTPEERAAIEAKERANLKTLLADLEQALQAGSLDGFAARVTDKTRFRLGFRDMAAKAFVAEMDGDGLAAGQAQLEWLKQNLGDLVSADCGSKEEATTKELPITMVMSSCRVRTAKPGHGFTSFVTSRDGVLTSLEINYMNEKVFLLNRDYLAGQGVVQ